MPLAPLWETDVIFFLPVLPRKVRLVRMKRKLKIDENEISEDKKVQQRCVSRTLSQALSRKRKRGRKSHTPCLGWG